MPRVRIKPEDIIGGTKPLPTDTFDLAAIDKKIPKRPAKWGTEPGQQAGQGPVIPETPREADEALFAQQAIDITSALTGLITGGQSGGVSGRLAGQLPQEVQHDIETTPRPRVPLEPGDDIFEGLETTRLVRTPSAAVSPPQDFSKRVSDWQAPIDRRAQEALDARRGHRMASSIGQPSSGVQVRDPVTGTLRDVQIPATLYDASQDGDPIVRRRMVELIRSATTPGAKPLPPGGFRDLYNDAERFANDRHALIRDLEDTVGVGLDTLDKGEAASYVADVLEEARSVGKGIGAATRDVTGLQAQRALDDYLSTKSKPVKEAVEKEVKYYTALDEVLNNPNVKVDRSTGAIVMSGGREYTPGKVSPGAMRLTKKEYQERVDLLSGKKPVGRPLSIKPPTSIKDMERVVSLMNKMQTNWSELSPERRMALGLMMMRVNPSLGAIMIKEVGNAEFSMDALEKQMIKTMPRTEKIKLLHVKKFGGAKGRSLAEYQREEANMIADHRETLRKRAELKSLIQQEELKSQQSGKGEASIYRHMLNDLQQQTDLERHATAYNTTVGTLLTPGNLAKRMYSAGAGMAEDINLKKRRMMGLERGRGKKGSAKTPTTSHTPTPEVSPKPSKGAPWEVDDPRKEVLRLIAYYSPGGIITTAKVEKWQKEIMAKNPQASIGFIWGETLRLLYQGGAVSEAETKRTKK